MSHVLTKGRTLAIAVAIGLASDCSAAAPGVTRLTYDVTTTLDSFSFETGAPSPPDCPNSTPNYCTHLRAFADAELSGTLILIDSASNPAGYAPTGTFGGKFCDSIDVAGLTGCQHVAAVPLTSYDGGLWGRFPPGYSGFLGQVGGSGSTPAIYFTGTIAEDSLYGSLRWVRAPGRSPPTHYGRFVARRRR